MEAGHFLSPDSEAMRTGTETVTLDLKRNLMLYRNMKEKVAKEERESRAYGSPALTVSVTIIRLCDTKPLFLTKCQVNTA